jgi:hypothetical protein
MEEKRKFPRFTVDVEVYWKKISSADEKTAQHISHAKDASLGGICLVLHPGIVAGDTLQLDIRLPGKKSILLKGKVTWVNPHAHVGGRTSVVYEGGVEFLDMNDEIRKEIEHFISHSFDVRGHK